ncbi:alpha/beta hydrolase [Novosphingobium sp. KCTC 2891]|uniref:alpha/beta hydrolase n=1 Tax=Novosphingobium sp. KCTC 2891 TaxID=2989730 RepID=UPI002222B945|nr:alpha/beta hydrolase [Novosphingobium sp. KCTC 2891]MCW1385016.1 alpha/beta hydrolase [Novosphingobium sp. KCTC 2891]
MSQETNETITLHHEVQRLLTAAAANRPTPFETLSPVEARAQAKLFAPQGVPVPVGLVEDMTFPGPAGATACRCYWPATALSGPLPAILYFHGGGWVLCDIETHDDICRRLCAGLSAVVVSVGYRLSPETRFPGAVHDCLAALDWVQSNGAGLGLDPAQLFVAGDSAGGNLAAVVALASRNRGGDMPALAGQMLFYPVTDLGTEHLSYATCSDALPLTAANMRWFRGHYLDAPASGMDWQASPLRADDVSGVCPALVMTAQHDPLCDEGIAYARKLAQGGGEVAHIHYYNQVHGFLSLASLLSDGPAALSMACDWARAVLKTGVKG